MKENETFLEYYKQLSMDKQKTQKLLIQNLRS